MNTGQDNMEPSEEEIEAALDGLVEDGLLEEVPEWQPTFLAIVGVPGSGKTELANAIAAQYDGNFPIIDGYAQSLAEDIDLGLGPYANYVTNIMVAMERQKIEHLNRKDLDRNGITVGTLIESLAYAALLVEYHNMQITTPQQQAVIARETLGSQVISLMIQDVMRYHTYFHIKLPPEIAVPGQDPKYDNYTRSLDNAITQIIQTLGIPVTTVSGTVEQQLETVRETLDERVADMAALPRRDSGTN